MSGALLTARDARVSGDFRAVDLDGVELLLPAAPLGAEGEVRVKVGALSLRGMAPWASASTLPAGLRALIVALTAWSTAALAAYALLRRPDLERGRLGALVLGASGPLAALAVLRLLERADAAPPAFALVPPAGVLGVLVAAGLSVALARLRWPGRTASK
jgi:hypothetical protein